jgi:hypothetical protein
MTIRELLRGSIDGLAAAGICVIRGLMHLICRW